MALRHIGGQAFQMALAGSNLDFTALAEQTGNIANLQAVLCKLTGRDDFVIKGVTNWQGEWRSIPLVA